MYNIVLVISESILLQAISIQFGIKLILYIVKVNTDLSFVIFKIAKMLIDFLNQIKYI